MKITEVKKKETTKSVNSGSVSVTSSNVDMTDSVTNSKESSGVYFLYKIEFISISCFSLQSVIA